MFSFTFLGLEWELDFTSWTWWVAQGFSVLLLVCLVVSMQQKSRTRLMLWNTVGIASGLIGAIFLGIASVIILMAISLARNTIVLIFSYFKKVRLSITLICIITLSIAFVAANIIFWENWLSGMSIAVGIGFLIGFFQTTPKKMRLGISIVRIPAFIFSILTTNLVQGITELFAFISGVIAIKRLDMKKKQKPEPTPVEDIPEPLT
jgi:hypothetical protein